MGGSGFIGTRLARRLLAAGREVRILDKAPSEAYPDRAALCDVRDAAGLASALEGCAAVYHLAAEHRDDVRPESLYEEVNVGGARNLCAAADSAGIDRIVFTSSVAVYGLPERETDETAAPAPFNEYGRTKLAAEKVFQAWRAARPETRALTIVRPTVVFGEGNRGNVYNLLRQIASGLFVMVGDGRNRKSMAYVENMAAFLEFLLDAGPGERVVNYVDKPDLDMNALVALAREAFGRRPAPALRLPYGVAYGLGRALDLAARATGRTFPVSAVRVKKFCASTAFSARRAADLGFKPPVALEEGLRRTIAAEFGAASKAEGLRTLYVSQYFPPEMGAPSARVHELSREWARAGDRVTVLTAFANHPLGVKRAEDRGRITRRERLDGIDVLRCYIYAAPNKGTGRRMASYLSFLLSAVALGPLRVRRPDVVVGTSPQLLCAFGGYLLARLFRRPFVFEVRDLWPESILVVGAMRENAVVRGLKRLARLMYEGSARIVTVTEGLKREIVKGYGVPESKIEVVTNGIDAALFAPGPSDNEVRRERGWEGRFVAMYLGTHGMAHALDRVLDAAALLRDDPEILVVLVGEGAEKDALKARAEALRLKNVRFIDQQPKELVPAFYAACDVGVVTLRDTALFRGALPSKLFEYLAMERPVLLGVAGEAADLIAAAGAGECVPPEDARALAEAIRRLSKDRARLAEMGKRGRAYVLEHYDRRALAARYRALLQEAAAGEQA